MDIVDLLASMDARAEAAAARHEALLAKMDTTLAKMDERLARQDQILANQAATLDHLVTLTDVARQEATAAHQAMAVALTRYAETRLDVDHFIATAERVLAAWEQRSRTP
jgi:hypothetical protein